MTVIAEDLRPTFIRDGDAALFSCLHLPITGRREHLIVICNALCHEYERSHRALRQLAAQFAAQGFAVLRFDYSGTGDSAGDLSADSPAQWRRDLRDAAAFGLDRARADKYSLIGLRYGALLAQSQLADPSNCASGVLWAPILTGAQMIAEWDAQQKAHERAMGYAAQTNSVLGWPAPCEWKAALARETLTDSAVGVPLLALAQGGGTSAEINALRSRLAPHAPQLEFEIDDSGAWWIQDAMNAIAPGAPIKRIVDWVKAIDDAG